MNKKVVVLSGLIVASLLSCDGVRRDEQRLAEQARTISEFPISRRVLISTLHLEDVKSIRSGGSIRNGHMRFFETWHLPNGLLINAYDSDVVNDPIIIRRSIDDILKTAPPNSIISGSDTRPSFQQVWITTSSGERIFVSKAPT